MEQDIGSSKDLKTEYDHHFRRHILRSNLERLLFRFRQQAIISLHSVNALHVGLYS